MSSSSPFPSQSAAQATALQTVLARIESDAAPEAGAAFAGLVAAYFAACGDEAAPVFTSLTPEGIAARLAAPPSISGADLDTILSRLATEIIPDANWLTHPMYMGHQVSAPLPAAVWTDALISALNNSLAVWEMSPVGTVLETRLIRWMADIAGFGASAGGTFTAGGTEATCTALLAARNAKCPGAWDHGGGEGVIVCGDHAHYSVSRAAGMLGLGTRNVVRVGGTDLEMDPGALARTLDTLAAEGRPVIAAVATAGSTATGTFDNLDAIGTECERRGVWLHVDAAHGGGALLSDRHRHLVRGIERARSIAWDPHKMMLMPLSAGVVLVRQERDLEAAFAQNAPYLFHGDGAERSWDQGIRSAQCSRRMDALKVWVALERYGVDGISALYDHLADLARHMHAMIREREDFLAAHEPECNILCFRYTGGRDPSDPALDAINGELRERYNRSGRGWITTTLLGGRRVLRVTFMNPRTTVDHVDRLLDGLAEIASSTQLDR